MGGYAQVQARFLIPGWTLVVPEGSGRHRKGGAGLPSTMLITKVVATSNSRWIRVTGKRGDKTVTFDLRPDQNVQVQH
jgi:hypothetical protein